MFLFNKDKQDGQDCGCWFERFNSFSGLSSLSSFSGYKRNPGCGRSRATLTRHSLLLTRHFSKIGLLLKGSGSFA